jgi:hypothetical protein
MMRGQIWSTIGRYQIDPDTWFEIRRGRDGGAILGLSDRGQRTCYSVRLADGTAVPHKIAKVRRRAGTGRGSAISLMAGEYKIGSNTWFDVRLCDGGVVLSLCNAPENVRYTIILDQGKVTFREVADLVPPT